MSRYNSHLVVTILKNSKYRCEEPLKSTVVYQMFQSQIQLNTQKPANILLFLF